ncbi:hypothetical protein JL722_4205 [Aureococcus anophagefferens]|nr:hypothetical protein JL722_4205 [Aureococcus anophagefferens]
MLRLAALLASLHVASSDDHSCAAGLTMDVYANGASTNPVRVELDGGHCGTMAAFEAAVSRAACGDPAACHVRDGAGRRVRKCSQLSRSSADFGVQPPASRVGVGATCASSSRRSTSGSCAICPTSAT